MKKSIWKVILCVSMLFVLFLSTVSATSVEGQKAELRQKTVTTLDQLYQKQPKARYAIEHAAGYAVFNNTGFQLGLLGTAHGRGLAANNITGQEVFMNMKQYQAGLGLGIKEYAVIFVFSNQDAWNTFVNKGWSFGGQATAVADDGVNGDSMEGAFQVAPGTWLYQMATKGLSAELTVGGTNYYKDKDLN